MESKKSIIGVEEKNFWRSIFQCSEWCDPEYGGGVGFRREYEKFIVAGGLMERQRKWSCCYRKMMGNWEVRFGSLQFSQWRKTASYKWVQMHLSLYLFFFFSIPGEFSNYPNAIATIFMSFFQVANKHRDINEHSGTFRLLLLRMHYYEN